MDASESKSLPENAYRPLAPGEIYKPVVPASANLPEDDLPLGRLGTLPLRHLHRRLGLLGPEGRPGDGGRDPDLDPGDRARARLPAPLEPARERHHHRHRRRLRLASSRARSSPCRRSTSSSSIPHPLQTIFICLAGGCLGVLFLIPLRRYFVRDMHGQLPYPGGDRDHRSAGHGREGRLAGQAAARRRPASPPSTTSSSPRSRSGRRPSTSSSSRRCRRSPSAAAWSSASTPSRFILGLGYVMGLRASMILCAGGVLSNFVLVPLIWFIGRHLPTGGLSGDDADRRT